jgi:hypothetical protein
MCRVPEVPTDPFGIPIVNIFSSKMYSIDYAWEKSFVSL